MNEWMNVMNEWMAQKNEEQRHCKNGNNNKTYTKSFSHKENHSLVY